MRGFDNLEVLHLDHNNLQDISALGLFKYDELEEVDLSYNSLTSFEQIKDITSLKRIYLQNNQIEEIPELSQIEHLDQLHLSNNDIYDITGVHDMESIQELYLNDNLLNDDPGMTINNRSGEPDVLDPVDPNKYGVTLGRIELWNNPSLDGVKSQEIIERLEDSGTEVID